MRSHKDKDSVLVIFGRFRPLVGLRISRISVLSSLPFLLAPVVPVSTMSAIITTVRWSGTPSAGRTGACTGTGPGSISASVGGLPGVSIPSSSPRDDSFVQNPTILGCTTQDISEPFIAWKYKNFQKNKSKFFVETHLQESLWMLHPWVFWSYFDP